MDRVRDRAVLGFARDPSWPALPVVLVSSGPAAELARDDKIRRAYLGVH